MSGLYCTAAEFTAWPTGLDLQNLIPDGTGQQQTAELGTILQAASSYVEQLTYQALYGRSVTEVAADARSDGEGRLQVRLRSFPARRITAAQWTQSSLSGWTPISVASAHITGELRGNYYADDIDYRIYRGWARPPFTVVTQYCSGYPNALLTAGTAAGATSLQVDDATAMEGPAPLGSLMLPGTLLTIYDATGGGQEIVAVQAVSGTTVTLAAPTLYAHASGVRVSALPEAVSTASLYLAAWMIKERRAGGGVLMHGTLQPASASEDLRMAEQLLLPFRRVV